MIPADDLAEMGLTAGQEVFVAYIADDDMVNHYEEFAISAVSLSELNDAQQISIPNALLQEAGIDPGCELQIACIEGAIIIAEDTAMNEEELYEVIERLRTLNSLAPNQPCIEKGGTFRDSYE